MKEVNTAKPSIASVHKSAQASSPGIQASNLKSNNGIENSKTTIEGKERSEGILEAMFEFGIQYAQEFAQRDLDDDLRWWQKKSQESMIENYAMYQRSSAAQASTGAMISGLSGLSSGLAALSQGESSSEEDSTQSNFRGERDKQEYREGQAINPDTVAQNNVSENWQEQSPELMDATDPDIFS